MSVATQPATKKKSKAIIWLVVLVVAAAGFYKLNLIRKDVGGVKNMFSRAYWKERINGTDLYNPQTKFFKRGNRANHEVCLTFDDGPHPASCQPILDILKKYDAKASFFLVGKRIKEHPELAKAIIDSGNEVGNHTQDHLRLDTLRADQVKNELVNCETNFFRATGSHMHLFRPPGMRFNDDIMATVNKMNYVTVGWDVGAKDFVGANLKGKTQSPQLIADSVLKQLDDGVIILLHDNPDTAEALPAILDKLKADGYKVLDASQMMAHLPKPVIVETNAR